MAYHLAYPSNRYINIFILLTFTLLMASPAYAQDNTRQPAVTSPLPTAVQPWEDIEAWLNMRDDVTYPQRVEETCTGCHGIPDPRMLSTETWRAALRLMQLINEKKLGILYSDDEWGDIRDYYLKNSLPAQAMKKLPPDPMTSTIDFQSTPFGASGDGWSMIGDVNIVDVDQDGQVDVLVCDSGRGLVTWIHQPSVGGIWQEDVIANCDFPVRTRVFDFNNDNYLDIVVSDLGTIEPTDDLRGKVVLLMNQANKQFDVKVLLENIPKIADIHPGDIDNDGDIDFSLGLFGYMLAGDLSWLEQLDDGTFRKRMIDERAGPTGVPMLDMNGDGLLDIVSLNTQEHEEVVCYINTGRPGSKRFEPYILWQAGIPVWGSAAITLVDLDQDGDQDILYTNGDAADLPVEPKPFHGLQWLENLGDLKFKFHNIVRMYGAYRSEAGDMDQDGDLDIVLTAMYNDWGDMRRRSIVWLENDGKQNFTGHGIDNQPTHLMSLDVGDLNQDGKLDIIAGAFQGFKSNRPGRVTVWLNQPGQGFSVWQVVLASVAMVVLLVALVMRKRTNEPS